MRDNNNNNNNNNSNNNNNNNNKIRSSWNMWLSQQTWLPSQIQWWWKSKQQIQAKQSVQQNLKIRH